MAAWDLTITSVFSQWEERRARGMHIHSFKGHNPEVADIISFHVLLVELGLVAIPSFKGARKVSLAGWP